MTPGAYIFLGDGTFIYLNLFKNIKPAECGAGVKCRSLAEFQTNRGSSSKFWNSLGYIIFDLNGIKPPNKYGRDIFRLHIDNYGSLHPEGGMSYAIYMADGPECSDKNNMSECPHHWLSNNERESCKLESLKYGFGCAGRIVEQNWEMKY